MKIFIGCFLLLYAAGALGKEQIVRCPKRYPAHELKLADIPAGWDGVAKVGANLLLDGGGMIAGPEDSEAELIGSGAVNTKQGQEVRYPMSAGEKWFFCSYGQGAVQLRHRIAADATLCVVKSARRKGHQDADARAICK